MMKSYKLKPCPFCGEEVGFVKYHAKVDADLGYSPSWFVRCMECGSGSWYYDKQEQAAQAWNKRDNFFKRLKRWIMRYSAKDA